MNKALTSLFSYSLIALAMPAVAQQAAPNAGQVLRDLQRAAPDLPPPLAYPLQLQPLQIPKPSEPVGPQITLIGITFVGNTVIDSNTLLSALPGVLGQSMDLAGLRYLAQRVALYYRANGYPFAHAYLPEQDVTAGQLRIALIEGRYGTVKANSQSADLAAAAQLYLARLAPGSVIQQSPLERATLILNELPGIQVAASISPGANTGTGNLDVDVTRTRAYNAYLGVDNHGSRYTGANRLRADLQLNSPFRLGDQLNLSANGNDQQLFFGNLDYSTPWGVDGLRANVGLANTRYQLGEGFEGNGGSATVTNIGLSYAWIRQRTYSLTFNGVLQRKSLFSSFASGEQTERYHIDALPMTLRFEHREALGTSAVTSGSLTSTLAKLKKNEPSLQSNFFKSNLDLLRLQPMSGNWSLSARMNAQWANKQLDSSEKFSLGGANSVRAFPNSGAIGDTGWLAQLELRYLIGNVMPYVFYDHGLVKSKVNELDESPQQSNQLSGAGIGLRYQDGPWRLDTVLARRTKSTDLQDTQTQNSQHRVWMTLGYQF